MTISVALCTYNGSMFIEQQLRSIICQHKSVDEIVVSDDGSTDCTITVVKKLAEKHDEIKWIILQNVFPVGVVRNFEKAILHCTGDIIFLSDQDDIWKRNKTQVIIDYLQNNPFKNVIFTNADLINAQGLSLTHYTLFDAFGMSNNMDLWEKGFCFEMLNAANRITGATVAFRKKYTQAFIPFIKKDGYLHDWQMAMCACMDDCLGVIEECLISYRLHDSNVAGIKKNKWIFTGQKPPKIFKEIVEPYPIRDSRIESNSLRFIFYKIRLGNYSTMWGKLKLLGLIFRYYEVYKEYWFIFFFSDILYGVNTSFRRWLLDSVR